MNKNFPDTFFQGNRKRLRQECVDSPLIVVTANGLLQKTGDNAYNFQQDSNFWYLTGINEPDITLVLDGIHEYLIVPSRTATREAFDGSLDHKVLTGLSGVTKIVEDIEGWKRLRESLSHSESVATIAVPPAYIEQIGIYTNPARARLVSRLDEGHKGLEIVDIREKLARMRMVKQPDELAALQSAIEITMDSLETVFSAELLPAYGNEYEIEADLTREFRRRGAVGHAFAPIVAGGKRACTLHNVVNDAPLHANELLVLDVGAEVSHYAADITRTISRTKPTDRQQQVFDAVIAVQDYALGLIKPGMVMKEYETAVETFMGTQLIELGLIKIADHDLVRKYYPHATSHFLGLDAHDAGDYHKPLPAGAVITCEPGIYIPEEGIGIRIEDDVLLTPSGNTVLSGRLSRQLSPR